MVINPLSYVNFGPHSRFEYIFVINSLDGRLTLLRHRWGTNSKPLYFRSEMEWEEINDPGDPRFGFLEGWETLEEFLDFISYAPHSEGIVHDLLRTAAIQWFDAHAGDEYHSRMVAALCPEQNHMEVRLAKQFQAQLLLVSTKAIWRREDNGSWQLEKHLKQQDLLHRSAINQAASQHLKNARLLDNELRLNHGAVERGTALSYGASFEIIPTMETQVLALAKARTLDWFSAESFLAIWSTAKFACNEAGQARELVVTAGVKQWTRQNGDWRQDFQSRASELTYEIDLSRLEEATTWWDTVGMASPPGRASTFDSNWLAFVTDEDPDMNDDFRLLDLVFGDIEDGRGVRRYPGRWVDEYIPAFDSNKNEYLKYMDHDNHGIMAVSFWDSIPYGSRQVYWSDFANWLLENAPTTRRVAKRRPNLAR